MENNTLFSSFSSIFLATSAANNCEKKAVIQSAASASSARARCASNRLDHGLKFYVIRGGCASSRLISEFSDSAKLRTLSAPSGAQMLVSGAWAPETSIYKISDLLPKSQKFQNGFVDPPSPVFVTAKPFFAIFGSARGQIFGKRPKKS